MTHIKKLKTVQIFTDGACKGNPGPGGWGVILRYGDEEKELCGGELHTTNNQMELKAALMGLRTLKQPCRVFIFTDSQYLQNGVTKWMKRWQRNGWKTADKKPVKNVALWQALQFELEKHQIDWHWVRGHSNHPENDRADALANEGLRRALQKV